MPHFLEDTPVIVYPLLVCCLAVAVLTAWSSLALVLRRLRDTRFGLVVLPLCLPAFAFAAVVLANDPFLRDRLGIESPQHAAWLADVLFYIVAVSSLVFTCLPGRQPSS